MAGNFAYFKSFVGFVKICQLFFGIITVACGLAAFNSAFIEDRAFIGSAIVVFLITLLYLLILLSWKESQYKTFNKVTDGSYNFLGGILLIITASFFIASTNSIEDLLCSHNIWEIECQDKSTKLAAGSFGIINGIVYILLSPTVFMQAEPDSGRDAEFRYSRPKQPT